MLTIIEQGDKRHPGTIQLFLIVGHNRYNSARFPVASFQEMVIFLQTPLEKWLEFSHHEYPAKWDKDDVQERLYVACQRACEEDDSVQPDDCKWLGIEITAETPPPAPNEKSGITLSFKTAFMRAQIEINQFDSETKALAACKQITEILNLPIGTQVTLDQHRKQETPPVFTIVGTDGDKYKIEGRKQRIYRVLKTEVVEKRGDK